MNHRKHHRKYGDRMKIFTIKKLTYYVSDTEQLCEGTNMVDAHMLPDWGKKTK